MFSSHLEINSMTVMSFRSSIFQINEAIQSSSLPMIKDRQD